jgi:hypothetical protein
VSLLKYQSKRHAAITHAVIRPSLDRHKPSSDSQLKITTHKILPTFLLTSRQGLVASGERRDECTYKPQRQADPLGKTLSAPCKGHYQLELSMSHAIND